MNAPPAPVPRGVLTGPDCPDRLIGDNNFGYLFRRQVIQPLFHLEPDNPLGDIFPSAGRFTHAEYRSQPGFKTALTFLLIVSSSVKDSPTFGD